MTELRGDFSVVLFLIIAGVVAYLAQTKVIGNWGVPFGLLAAAIAAVIVGHFDQIEKLTFQVGENRRVLVETKQVRDEVYAKAAEVRRLAAGVAAFTVAAIMGESRLAASSLEHHERMLRRRDELQKFLAESGVDTNTSGVLLGRITALVDWDLRRAIVTDTVAAWHPAKGEDPTDSKARDAFQERLEKTLQLPDRLTALDQAEKAIEQEHHLGHDSASYSITPRGIYRQLLTSGRLPRLGAADDLRHAPIE